MSTVTSRDGTIIGYDRIGEGPPLILVGGALAMRPSTGENPFARLLSERFTVIDYDRRGRGESTDTPPYAVEREVEDIEALIDATGGTAFVHGFSSGAVLALEAASRLADKVARLSLYEPPLILDDSRPPLPADYVERLNAAIADGQPGTAVEIFMVDAVGIPREFVAGMRNAPPAAAPADDEAMQPPSWSDLEKVAHTLAYDGLIVREFMQGKPLPAGQWASVTAPTLVITGGDSEPFFHTAAKAIVSNLPHAEHRVLPGQTHAVAPAALVPVLIEFFSGQA
ncbi:MAG TPA: alpha/beta hydrolase [Aggregatilineales bacterium]|nr:alpha/beta hydrolase [Chloroflexota bacterium]HOA25450.1 alpha/beta hydrolase [Aggregatilineales bacterium]HPV06370.1 alpha/beta hydrolase [Aggregatilineales bacterium]HQA69764.1 alpha/beta hydrolase [Aggregatilineales bacterium]